MNIRLQYSCYSLFIPQNIGHTTHNEWFKHQTKNDTGRKQLTVLSTLIGSISARLAPIFCLSFIVWERSDWLRFIGRHLKKIHSLSLQLPAPVESNSKLYINYHKQELIVIYFYEYQIFSKRNYPTPYLMSLHRKHLTY